MQTPPIDPSWTVSDLFERARGLAVLALRPETAPDAAHRAAIADRAHDLQAACARVSAVPLPPLRRARRTRTFQALDALAVAADDLAAVVLLRCAGPDPVGDRALPDLPGLLRRIGERHDHAVEQLGRAGLQRGFPSG